MSYVIRYFYNMTYLTYKSYYVDDQAFYCLNIWDSWQHWIYDICITENTCKQAGAELCQAQEKQGLAESALPVVVFHLL